MKKLRTIVADNSDINNILCQQIEDYLLEIENLV